MNAPEWFITARGFLAHALHVPLHWLNIALLPYAGDWTYRRERREAFETLSASDDLNMEH